MRILTLLFFFIACIPALRAQEARQEARFTLKSLGKKVNTRYHDTAPLISPDGKVLYFTVNDHPENTHGKGSQDIWYAQRDDQGNWSEAKHMPKPFNQNKFNQALSLSSDGNTLLIRGGSGRDKLGFSLCHRENGIWQKLVAQEIDDFNKMCKGRFNGAFLARDASALLLYFNENEEATFSDLYVCFPEGPDKWSKPQRINALNTRQDEFGPYLAPDNRTLYFASNRPGGFGSVDIYRTVRQDDSWLNWSTPENIGQPVNTGGFDAYYAVGNADTLVFTTRAYMSADGGQLDIYTLQRVKEKKPVLTMVVAAADKKTGETIMPADISVSYQQTVLDSLIPMNDGSFKLALPGQAHYKLQAHAAGYLDGADSFFVTLPRKDSVLYKTIYLQPLEVGLAVRLNNIFFEFDKAELLPGSFPELNKVVQLLKDNPNLFIEIGGHTDNKGSDEYNENLSLERARAVRDYLLNNWISSDRVRAKGYGESQPEVPNISEENRQINRRVVFTVLKNDKSFMVSK